MSKQRVCDHCKRDFWPRRSNQRFCGPQCQQRTWVKSQIRETRTFNCPQCDKEVVTSDIRKKVCSPECNWRKQNDRRERLTLDPKPCIGCNEEFRPKHHNTVYCSIKCRNRTNYRKNISESTERNFEFRKRCKWDGNWYAALQRDRFTCQSCGVKSYPSQWKASKRKKLVVHHRDGSGETKDKNHSLENLQTLCAPCHREFHNIFLIYDNGEYRVAGDQFQRLGIGEIKTSPSPHTRASQP